MVSLDSVRGLYVRGPHWMRRVAAPILSAVPMRYRLGSTYGRVIGEIERAQNSVEFIREYQTRRLQYLVGLAVEKSPYYGAMLRTILGDTVRPYAFTVEDLARLPILEKSTVRSHADDLLVVPKSEADVVTTSGSSGTPLQFYLDKGRSAGEWAFVNHIWSRVGYKAHHRRAVLRGVFMPSVEVRPWEFDPALNELRLSPFHLVPDTMERYLELLHRFRVNFLHGYPSALTILASYALKVDWRPPKDLIGVLPISERLFPDQREQISRAFHTTQIMPFYGLSEKVAIAGEVIGSPDTYEFEPLYGITELVDSDGRPVDPGARGRIVSTGMLSVAMPLFRYDTADEATLVELPTRDNGYRLKVRDISSRWGQEFLISKSGGLISMAAINIHSLAYARVREFQFFQDTPGLAVLRVVPSEGQTETSIAPLLHEIQNKVGGGVMFRLELANQLYTNERGKRGFLDQRLDVRQYA